MDNELMEKIKLAQKGDKKVLNEIVKENYGLVYSIAKRFYNRGYEQEDINQIGALGLVKAIQKFDFSYNVVLSTFAVTYIIGEIKRFLRDDGPIKISRELKRISVQIAEEKKKDENLTINELSKRLKVSKEDIMLALESNNIIESLDNKNDDDGISLIERIKTNDNSEEKIIDKIMLMNSIKKLDEKDKKIIYLRYFKCQTQKNVAKIIGMSQVQVSRRENKILNKMQKELLDA